MANSKVDEMARAMRDTLISPNVWDSNGEPANVVDVIYGAGRNIANAITPRGVAPAQDGNGGYVASLTEAVMSVAASLDALGNSISDAINNLAEAIREHKQAS